MTTKTKKTIKTRIKAQAEPVAQSREEVQKLIKKLGDVQREHGRVKAEMDDQIAVLTDTYSAPLNEHEAQIESLQKRIQGWCEANRAELTKGGNKSVNLVTGEVNWRLRPKSITVRGKDAVIENLRKLGLGRFIRIKEEVNKEAMLNEPDVAAGVAGITVKSGVEDFEIKPFESEV